MDGVNLQSLQIHARYLRCTIRVQENLYRSAKPSTRRRTHHGRHGLQTRQDYSHHRDRPRFASQEIGRYVKAACPRQGSVN